MSGLRSSQWYGGDDRNAYIHRAWMRRGAPESAFDGRPQIVIANTASDLTPCNAHLSEVAQAVKNGVYEAGGIPLELPVVSLGPLTRLTRTTSGHLRLTVAREVLDIRDQRARRLSCHARCGILDWRWRGTDSEPRFQRWGSAVGLRRNRNLAAPSEQELIDDFCGRAERPRRVMGASP